MNCPNSILLNRIFNGLLLIFTSRKLQAFAVLCTDIDTYTYILICGMRPQSHVRSRDEVDLPFSQIFRLKGTQINQFGS